MSTYQGAPSSRSELERRFRRAARHSWRVRLLRRTLPVTVVTAALCILALTWFNPLRIIARLPQGGSLAISGSKIVMELPRMAGYTKDARSYEVSARSANQDFTHPDEVELEGVAAKVEVENQGLVEVNAANGVYHPKTQQMVLGNSVLLKSSAGYEAHLTDASIDMRSGSIVSEQPVEVKLLNGVLNAQRLEVAESGALMRFSGGVAMTLDISGNGATATVRTSP
jgi:lipopolysaccharide export system protein LptC